jgi:hypothetical protein
MLAKSSLFFPICSGVQLCILLSQGLQLSKNLGILCTSLSNMHHQLYTIVSSSEHE